MKKIIFILSIFFICTPAFAERYRAVDDNGTVALVLAVGNIDEAWGKHPLYGHAFLDIDSARLPSIDDRKYWKISGNSVIVDSVKKQSDIDLKSAKESGKDAVLAKLKISKDEFDKLVS